MRLHRKKKKKKKTYPFIDLGSYLPVKSLPCPFNTELLVCGCERERVLEGEKEREAKIVCDPTQMLGR